MKLQGFSVVFALICIPLILVMSYYIQLQVDTITLQNQYDTKLIDASYDAMSSFELNTANEDLSLVSDSLRTIIEASNNIFMSTLATNLGMSNASKSMVEPYIPAIVYTLYDGYYIYSPTYSTSIVTDSDGVAIKVGDLGVTISGDGYSYLDPSTCTTYQNALTVSNDYTNPNREAANDYIEAFEKKYTISYADLKTAAETSGTISIEDYEQLLYKTDGTSSSDITVGSVGSTSFPLDASDKGTLTTGLTAKTDESHAKYTTKNTLKTYVPYSARYVQSDLHDPNDDTVTFDADINVIYTLDNYITIEGTFDYSDNGDSSDLNKKVYYTKSGYLLPYNNSDSATNRWTVKAYIGDSTNGALNTDENNIFTYSQEDIDTLIKSGLPIRIDVYNEVEDTYETVIDISQANNNQVIIDESLQNTNSINVFQNKVNNLYDKAQDYSNKINKNYIDITSSTSTLIDHSRSLDDNIIIRGQDTSTGEIVLSDIGAMIKDMLLNDIFVNVDAAGVDTMSGLTSGFNSDLLNQGTLSQLNTDDQKALITDNDSMNSINSILEYINHFLADSSQDSYWYISKADLLALFDDVHTVCNQLNDCCEYKIELNSSARYYAKAVIFTKWVSDYLSELKTDSIKEISGLNYSTYTDLVSQSDGDYSFMTIWGDSTSSTNVFAFNSVENSQYDDEAVTEIRKDTEFYQHKLNVIKTSIQYNLNLAMSAYNRHTYYNDNDTSYTTRDKTSVTVSGSEVYKKAETDYEMPVISDAEWEDVLDNISIITFMQGLNCGLKTYNNYTIVSSTNNEIVTTTDNIFYTKYDEFNNENSEYHRIGCLDVINSDNVYNNSGVTSTNDDKYISFTSKEVKYDKITNDANNSISYLYDHKNLACYDCINDTNSNEINIFDKTLSIPEYEKYTNLRKAFYIRSW